MITPLMVGEAFGRNERRRSRQLDSSSVHPYAREVSRGISTGNNAHDDPTCLASGTATSQAYRNSGAVS